IGAAVGPPSLTCAARFAAVRNRLQAYEHAASQHAQSGSTSNRVAKAPVNPSVPYLLLSCGGSPSLGMLIGQDGVIRADALPLPGTSAPRRQPRVHMLGLQIDDAAIVAGGGYVGRRLIGDGGKSSHIRFSRIAPVGPEAGDQHGLRRIRRELKHDILFPLVGAQRAPLRGVQFDVLIETLDDHDGVVMAELLAPELVEIVAPRVVEAWKLLVIGRRLACRTAEVAHRCEYIDTVLLDDQAGIYHLENAVVVRRGI